MIMSDKTKIRGRLATGFARFSLALASLLGLVAGFAAETPPDRMTYQGFLADANGAAIGKDNPANYTAIFRIYDASQGGNRLWSEQQVITIDNGLFSVILGEGSQFQSEAHGALSAVFGGSTADVRWVGITVVELGGTEIAPRLRLLTSPYAFLAASATTLSNGGSSFISKSGQNVSVKGDLRLAQDGTELVVFPRESEVIIGNSRDVPTRVSGDLRVSKGGRTMTINAMNGGNTHFSASSSGAYVYDGRLVSNANGSWGEFQPLAGTMLINTSADHLTIRDGSSKQLVIDPNDGGHTRFYNSEGGYIFNGFINVRNRDNAGHWTEISPQDGYTRLHTNGTRFVFRNQAGGEISLAPNDGGHPRFRAGEGQEWLFYGRNITAQRGSQWIVIEPNNSGDAMIRTNDEDFKFIDGNSGTFVLDPKDGTRSTFFTSMNGWTFKNDRRAWFIENRDDEIVFAQASSPVPYRFADHDVRVDKDIFARGSQVNSDRRLKKNIESLTEPILDRLSRLRPVRFHWKDEADEEEKTVGFIAQEVQEQFPDAIAENGDRLAISTSEIAAYTIAGLQEYKRGSDDRMAQLEEENAALKDQLDSLLQRVTELESTIR